MSILNINCPFCFHEGRTRAEYLGRAVRCSQCRQSFPVSSRVIGDAGRLSGMDPNLRNLSNPERPPGNPVLST